MKNYGLPYKGSKNKLAERILDMLPRAEHLYDLFCGGCSISHCALDKSRYNHVHVNDINAMMPQAFVTALQGGFENEDRWISHEEFFRLKDTDPYVAICFSFGNDLKTYCYGRDIEDTKKALHYAIFFGSYELSDSLLGVDLRPIERCATRQEKYLMAKRIIQNTPPQAGMLESWQRLQRIQTAKLGATSRYRGSFKKKNQRVAKLGATQPNIILQSWQNASRLHQITPPRLESMERLLQITNKVGNTSSLTWSTGDYQDVKIEDNSVIYADIPYKSTNTYVGEGKDFDYERFYDWCLKQTQPLFISSYEMPKSDFRVVAEFNRRDTMSTSSNSNDVTERIFIPRTQEYINKELKLF